MYEYSAYDGWEAWSVRLSKHARQKWLEARPCCAWCGERITDEYAYEFPDGDIVCEECLDEYVDDKFRTIVGR